MSRKMCKVGSRPQHNGCTCQKAQNPPKNQNRSRIGVGGFVKIGHKNAKNTGICAFIELFSGSPETYSDPFLTYFDTSGIWGLLAVVVCHKQSQTTEAGCRTPTCSSNPCCRTARVLWSGKQRTTAEKMALQYREKCRQYTL